MTDINKPEAFLCFGCDYPAPNDWEPCSQCGFEGFVPNPDETRALTPEEDAFLHRALMQANETIDNGFIMWAEDANSLSPKVTAEANRLRDAILAEDPDFFNPEAIQARHKAVQDRYREMLKDPNTKFTTIKLRGRDYGN